MAQEKPVQVYNAYSTFNGIIERNRIDGLALSPPEITLANLANPQAFFEYGPLIPLDQSDDMAIEIELPDNTLNTLSFVYAHMIFTEAENLSYYGELAVFDLSAGIVPGTGEPLTSMMAKRAFQIWPMNAGPTGFGPRTMRATFASMTSGNRTLRGMVCRMGFGKISNGPPAPCPIRVRCIA